MTGQPGASRSAGRSRLPDLIREQVTRTPDAPAVQDEHTVLSYRQLLRRADDLASRLRDAGVGRDTVVGVCVQRTVELPVLLLGVLLADGCYLPLDPANPTDRMAGMISDAGAALVLTDGHHSDAVRAAAGPVPVVDPTVSVGPLPPAHPAHRTAGPPGDLDLAYVIYTSGSTGRPKPVGVPHRGIVNRLRWMQDTYRLTAADAVLQKTPATFDVSVWEFFWPLTAGARLVMARPEGHRDPQYLATVIRQERITVVHFVPSMLDVLLEEPDFQRCDPLRLVVCSGEALQPRTVRRFRERSPARLDNLYGPTEASVDVTWWACRPAEEDTSVPIGRPVSNVDIQILDEHGAPAPTGAPGELCIGGDTALARGYLGRPALTAERFVPDPYAGTPGARLYRTGDLARWLPGGVLEFLGRVDHQIKLRGHRIEPGEIEETLCGHPAVTGAVVVARGDGSGAAKLVAYVVTTPDPPAERELRAYVGQRLPEHLVPTRIVPLDRFPVTANGKLDRAALPVPPRRRPSTAAGAARR